MLATNCLPIMDTRLVTCDPSNRLLKELCIPESATNLVALSIEVLVSRSNLQVKNSHRSYALASLEMNL